MEDCRSLVRGFLLVELRVFVEVLDEVSMLDRVVLEGACFDLILRGDRSWIWRSLVAAEFFQCGAYEWNLRAADEEYGAAGEEGSDGGEA